MIGVLTYHNNENKGAILQAYCLANALKKITKMPTEIIDYRPLSKEFIRLLSKNPKKSMKKISDYFLTESFLNANCNLSSKKLVTNNYEKTIRFIKKLNYDMIVVGSDVVWRIKKNGLRFSPPFPNAYFLAPSLNTIKVSYGASADTTSFERLTENDKKFLKQTLGAFNRISVRDNHTEHFLKCLGIEEFERVPDPTLLIRIPSINLTNFLESNGISLDKPILGLHEVKHPIVKKICEKYRKRGFQIVTPTTHPYVDIELFSKLDPIQYYSLYKYFDMVITSSFHSTIFSIKNNTPFITVDTKDVYKSFESKTHSLLEEFNLLDRHVDLVNGSTDFIAKIESCEERLKQSVINTKLSEFRNKGISYIDGLKEFVPSDN